MSYFERHIFFCLNLREDGRTSCTGQGAKAGFEHCKISVKNQNLSGQGKIRVNQSGCLNRCAGGPVAVVYPEAVWYTFVDNEDVDEIIESHLKNGVVVQRLVLPDSVGL
jgi:(2Fe-2S) ferredoxin